MLDRELRVAYAIAEALTAGKNATELARLQIVLQTISSLITAEINCKRLGSSTSGTGK